MPPTGDHWLGLRKGDEQWRRQGGVRQLCTTCRPTQSLVETGKSNLGRIACCDAIEGACVDTVLSRSVARSDGHGRPCWSVSSRLLSSSIRIPDMWHGHVGL